MFNLLLRSFFFIIFSAILSLNTYAQEDSKRNQFLSSFFLPSLEFGYMQYGDPSFTSGGLLVKTSLEYRWKRNNDIFLRLNYDNSSANYRIQPNSLTNVIEGKARFADFLLGGGYRFGEQKYRMFLTLQAGSKSYSYPTAEIENGQTVINASTRRVGLYRATLGFEYYLDENSALALEIIQSQVTKNIHFWQGNRNSWGISLGVIASLL